jgi:adenine-specific DNA-methyltransferase
LRERFDLKFIKFDLEYGKLEAKKEIRVSLGGRKRARKIVLDCQYKLPILKEIKNKEIITDPKGPINILIEGDNYHALSVLNYTHKGKIDVIYIDPPYNTGNKDFVYNDDFVDKDDTYKHSKWLSFMSKRLWLAKNLLKKDGLLAVSIDDNEIAQLKLLLDDLFDENIKIVVVKMSEASGLKMGATSKVGNIPKYKEYVIFAKKGGIKNLRFDPIKKIEWDNEYNIFIDNFSKEDRDAINQIAAKEAITNKDLEFLDNGILKNIKLLPVTRKIKQEGLNNEHEILEWKLNNAWRIARTAASTSVKKITDDKKKTVNQTIFSVTSVRDNILYIVKSDYNKISTKPRVQIIFADDNLEYHPGDIWTDIKTTGLEAEGGVDFKNGKKPLELVRRVIYASYNNNSIVCDFFAGSGTTGEAVLDLNIKDAGQRQFILCTYNKEATEEFIIDKYCYPRLLNAIRGYRKKKKLGGNLKYFKTDLLDVDHIARVSDEQKIKLTYQAGEMIALRENTFAEVERNEWWQIFSNRMKYTAIYFKENKSKLFKLLEKLNKFDQAVTLYIFSWGKNEYKNEFTEYKNIRVEDIPEPIINVYKEINKS